jgi:pyruvate/2-oxoglutarate/acetoin dehydrogenase E1 component/TPP-dependent pyruvate/acetoin dehydrogenase alpha subunit
VFPEIPDEPLGEDVLRSIYEVSYRIRAWETRGLAAMSAGEVFFPYWMVKGQELIAATVAQHLSPSDYMTTTYRGSHDQIAKGVPFRQLWAEVIGRGTGTSKGKGGTMHIAAPEVGLMLTTGIVGAGLPVAAGLALASQVLGDGRVTVCNFGEGASNQGAFHEALNLAATWKLPVVFLCQNNVYAEHTRFTDTVAVGSVAERAIAYGIPGISVDGTEPDQMYAAAQAAIEHARSGAGPVLLEANAWRLLGHGIGDQCKYMDADERAEAIADDPVPKLRARLLAETSVSEADLEALEKAARTEVEETLEQAIADPAPEPEELYSDVVAPPAPGRPAPASAPTAKITFNQALNQALDQAFERDDRVILFGEDVDDGAGGGVFLVSKGLSTKYGTSRVRNTPISEIAIMGAGIGSAMAGLRPVAEIMMMDFLGVCFDQLSNHAAKIRYMSGGRTPVPLTVRVGMMGGIPIGAQHNQSLEAVLMHIPGLKVVYPSTPYDAKGLLAACIEDQDPCVFIEAQLLMTSTGEVPVEHYTLPIGKADLKATGADVTVVTYGRLVGEALRAAQELEGEISVEVVDLRSIAPLDTETVLESVRKTGRAVIAHDAIGLGGVGAEISAMIHESLSGRLLAPVRRLAAPSTPSPASPALLATVYPSKSDIVEACRAAFQA